MKFNIKNIIGITVILISQVATAQLYVGVQSGIGDIKSDIKGVASSSKLGVAIKAGYIYSLTKNIGIGSGVEFSQYKQEVFLGQPSATFTNFEIDPSGSAFIYNITARDYKENQTLHALQIPLFLQYKTIINKGIEFNFRTGVKYFLPISYKIKSSASSVNGTGYYPDVNLYIDDLPEYGFGVKDNYRSSGTYNTQGILMSSFEIGFTFDMGSKSALYTAIFLENGYGTIIDQDENKSYISYNTKDVSNRKANGLYSTDKDAKIKPVAFGLTLGWNFK